MANSPRAPVLRIFSYLPNPRIFKATIAARLCGLEVELRGASPVELAGWLWDFEARPLLPGERERAGTTARQARTGFAGRLYKTDAFLAAHPFGTVPAAFSPDGSVGIFESNSIMRAVARLGAKRVSLYGADPYGASRIDSFLDASLVFARDAQLYLLALVDGAPSSDLHERMAIALDSYVAGIDRALAPGRRFLVGDEITLAEICFVAELALFSQERAGRSKLWAAGLAPLFRDELAGRFGRAMAHYARLCDHEAFAPDLKPYLGKVDRAAKRDAARGSATT